MLFATAFDWCVWFFSFLLIYEYESNIFSSQPGLADWFLADFEWFFYFICSYFKWNDCWVSCVWPQQHTSKMNVRLILTSCFCEPMTVRVVFHCMPFICSKRNEHNNTSWTQQQCCRFRRCAAFVFVLRFPIYSFAKLSSYSLSYSAAAVSFRHSIAIDYKLWRICAGIFQLNKCKRDKRIRPMVMRHRSAVRTKPKHERDDAIDLVETNIYLLSGTICF